MERIPRLRLRRQLILAVTSATATLLMGAAVVSCSGGGGGGGGGPSSTTPPAPSPPPTTPPPSNPPQPNRAPQIMSASATPTGVSSGGNFTLQVSASDPDGDTLAYTWTQTGGSPGQLGSPNSSTTTATAPQTTMSQTLSYQIDARDPSGLVASSVVWVTVTPASGGGGSTPPPVGTNITVTDQQLTYDAVGRLIEASLNGGQVRIRYQYDDDGNLTRREVVR